MQDVQTFRRRGVLPTSARTLCMFGFQRRGVRRCENDTLLPKPGPLPQTSQTAATVSLQRVVGHPGPAGALKGSRRAVPGANSVLTNPVLANPVLANSALRANRPRERAAPG